MSIPLTIGRNKKLDNKAAWREETKRQMGVRTGPAASAKSTKPNLLEFHARASGHTVGLEVLRRISEFQTEAVRLQFLDALKDVVQQRFCVLCGAETGGKQCYCAPCYDE